MKCHPDGELGLLLSMGFTKLTTNSYESVGGSLIGPVHSITWICPALTVDMAE